MDANQKAQAHTRKGEIGKQCTGADESIVVKKLL